MKIVIINLHYSFLFCLSFLASLSLKAGQPLFINSQSSQWADSVLLSMTLDQKIGQLFMVAAWSNRDSAHVKEISRLVTEYGIGGIIFFQGGPIRQLQLTNLYQSQARVPLLVGIDGEWGLSMRLDSTLRWPRQMTLSASHNDTLASLMFEAIAKECKRMGVHINFAPVLDINNNTQNPVIGSRSFGDDKQSVAHYGQLYAKALEKFHLLSNGKHFPGHGNTNIDSHYALPVLTSDSMSLMEMEVYPFKKLIDDGLASIMVGHLFVPAFDTTKNLPATLSRPIVTGFLKEKLNFSGLIITDALNMKGVTSALKPGTLEKQALLAGNDLLLYSENVERGISEIKNAVLSGEITEQEINQHVLKILMAKHWVGLGNIQQIESGDLVAALNPVEAKILQTRLFENAITVLKNDGVIPVRFRDSLRIASVVIGDKSGNAFQSRLNNYYRIDQYEVGREPTSTYAEAIRKYLENYDLIIVSLHNTTMNAARNYNIPDNTRDFIENIVSKLPVIFVNFGNAYTLSRFANLRQAKGILLAYEDFVVTQDLAAQLIFGGATSDAALPVSVNRQFKKNQGESSNEKSRLGFGLPEEVGLSSEKLSYIDSIAKRAIGKKAMPGCQVLVAKDGKVVYQKSFGTKTYLDSVAVKNTDIYDLASVTKIAATALGTMKLFDDGDIDLNKPLSRYLPVLKKTNLKPIIVRDMLAHQAGLKSWVPFWKQTMIGKQVNPVIYNHNPDESHSVRVADSLYMLSTYRDSLLSWIYQVPLAERGKMVYSDLGPILMKEAVEKISGEEFDKYLYKQFYKSLGLSRLMFNPKGNLNPYEIVPTELDSAFRKQLLIGNVHDPAAAMFGGVSGNAGLFSNSFDLAVIMQMLLNKGEYGGKRYLSKNTVSIFTRQQFPQNGNRRGLLFDKPETTNGKSSPCAKSASPETFGHQGFTGTCAWADPKHSLIFIFLSNRVHPDASNDLLIKLSVRTEIQQAVYDALIPGKQP